MRWILLLLLLTGCSERYPCDILIDQCMSSCRGTSSSVDVECFNKCAEAYDTCRGDR